ncbi:MAG TPA: DUF4822 domain-containing protein [Niabella sp.]
MKRTSVLIFLIASILFFNSCTKDNSLAEPVLTPAETLASTPWETTEAKNATGQSVPLNDANVSNFVGFAYFKSDSTFTMYNLDDSPKMKGNWWLSPDGTTRTIVARNDAGTVLFTRIVDIVALSAEVFTYRIYPDANDKTLYYDIIHTSTSHPEPVK